MSSNLKVNNILPSTGDTVAISGIASVTSSVSIASSCTATTFYGSGANLTNLPAQATIANNADNRIITGGSGVNLNAESELTYTSGALVNSGAGYRYMTIGSTNAQGAALGLDGDSNGDGAGGDYAYIQHDSSGNFNIVANNPAGNSNLILHSGAGAETLRISNIGHLTTQANNNGNPVGMELRNNNTAAYSHAQLTLTSQNATSSKIWCDVPNAGMRLQYNGGTTVKVNQSGNLVMASGSGIDFSATGNISGTSSELLDDYEEGSWTPVVGGWDTFTPYSGSSYYAGWYVKVGTMVHCGWKIYIQNLTTVSSSAHVRISGLPFASKSVSAGPVAAPVRFDIPEFGMSGYNLTYLGGNDTVLYMYKHVNGGGHLVSINAAGNRSNLWTMGTATYATDS